MITLRQKTERRSGGIGGLEQRLRPIILRAVLIFAGNFGITSISLAQGSWTSKTDMPTARGFLYACVVDSEIYAIGGIETFGQTPPLSTVEAYSPATDTWRSKTPMQTARWAHCAATVDGKVYVIGGSDHSNQRPLSSVESYDPATDIWTLKAPMPTARIAMKCGVVNGKIYVMGGTFGPNFPRLSIVEEYDPARDSWTKKADMDPGKWSYAVSVVDGIVYVIGGQGSAGGWTNTVQAYDPVTDSWTNRASLPDTGRTHFSASAVNGIIYAIGGGTTPTNIFSRVEAYNPATDTWQPMEDMPTARADFGIAVVGGKVYVIGGITSLFAPGLSTVEEYDPGIATAVENYGVEIPSSIELDQNYPNPFNPETRISYQLPAASDIELTIYDVLGRQVVTLVQTTQPEGRYEVTWNGRDSAGDRMASGMYIYRLQAGSFVKTRKMVLMR